MTPHRPTPVRRETAPEESPPSSTALQLQQIQLLQRRRKSLAAIELASARNLLQTCECQLRDSSEALQANQKWAASRRAQQAREITEAPRDTQELLRWRHRGNQLLAGTQAHWRAWQQAQSDHAQAGDEVARRLQQQRRLEVVDEKYGALLQELLAPGASGG